MDKDLKSIQEARRLLAEAAAAQKDLARFPQERLDQIVAAMAEAARREAARLAQMAVEETGYGNARDKTLKNLFSTDIVYNYIKGLRCVGLLNEDKENRIIEVGVPMGVVAAIIPSTNPTSTAIFKILIALKAGNGIVLSPHPAAARCICETARLMNEAALAAGAPRGIIGCMTEPTIEGTQALMRHELTSIILATGGMGLVRAAYSSGKPAIGVGPGNVPAFVERTADVRKAVRDVLAGKCFDHGTLCSSEQSIIVDAPIQKQVEEELVRQGGYFLNAAEKEALEKVALTPNRNLNTKIVGKSAEVIASMAGIKVPAGTRALIVRLEGVGRDHPLSMEKLSPILAFYVVSDWRQGCERCIEILSFGGLGHTLGLHTNDRQVVMAFAMEKPAFRICVNTPAAIGAIGYTTGLVPSMTLGCGAWGGNITSDNIGPQHLINIKRVAFEAREFAAEQPELTVRGGLIPSISRESIRQIVDQYLSRRGASVAPAAEPVKREADPAPGPAGGSRRAVEFVSEEDVRRALARNEKICVGPKTIITPLARDLGTEKDIFIFE